MLDKSIDRLYNRLVAALPPDFNKEMKAMYHAIYAVKETLRYLSIFMPAATVGASTAYFLAGAPKDAATNVIGVVAVLVAWNTFVAFLLSWEVSVHNESLRKK